ncbi:MULTISPECIES: Zn-ribbon domain-containing OB-fold protein [Sphingobium]|nr:OB-fold domain-containing protein [Sphingobium sp. 15-1]
MSEPQQQAPIAYYFQQLAAGHFMIQRSRSSGQYVFYPRLFAPGSGDMDLEWVEASGKGTIYSSTTIPKRPPEADETLSIIELEEGPRLLSRVMDAPAHESCIGDPVTAFIGEEDGKPILLFRREKQA